MKIKIDFLKWISTSRNYTIIYQNMEIYGIYLVSYLGSLLYWIKIVFFCKDNIQIGTFLATPKSKFIKKWLDGYRDKYHLYPNDYVAVSMCEPYKLYEKEPHKVFIENRLQMIYFNGWSAFVPRYIDMPQEDLLKFNRNLDFINDGTYGYHLPRHGSLFSRDDYDKSDKTHLPIKIATYILDLPFF